MVEDFLICGAFLFILCVLNPVVFVVLVLKNWWWGE
jgi:hypothetical protein